MMHAKLSQWQFDTNCCGLCLNFSNLFTDYYCMSLCLMIKYGIIVFLSTLAHFCHSAFLYIHHATSVWITHCLLQIQRHSKSHTSTIVQFDIRYLEWQQFYKE